MTKSAALVLQGNGNGEVVRQQAGLGDNMGRSGLCRGAALPGEYVVYAAVGIISGISEICPGEPLPVFPHKADHL